MAKAQDSAWDHAQDYWGEPTAEQVANQLKRHRSEEEEEEVEVGEEEAEGEVDADLRGRSTGSLFSSYVPRSMVRKQPEKQPEPKKQQPRGNPDRGAKILKKAPCKGGFTDRDISSPKLKKAVIAELKLLGPTSLPEKDQGAGAAGRVLHFPEDLVIRGESKATPKCYLPALRFVCGLDKPLPAQVTKVLVNADARQINLVRTNPMITIILTLPYLQALSNSGLTLAKQAQLHNNWLGLLERDAGCYMLVGKAGPTWNHWIAYNAWTRVLYDGGDIVRITEDADRDSEASAKAVFTQELQLDDLREVYVIKTYNKKKDKKPRRRGAPATEPEPEVA